MSDEILTPRPVRDSQSEMAEIVLPNDANPLNALLGGRLMHWIDLAGAMDAAGHPGPAAGRASGRLDRTAGRRSGYAPLGPAADPGGDTSALGPATHGRTAGGGAWSG